MIIRLVRNWLLFIVAVAAVYSSCTPKTGTSLSDNTTTEQPPVSESVNERQPCQTFDESPNKEDALTAYVLYRDFLKQGSFEEAFPYWEKTYEWAPGADGKRNTVFADGIKFYEHFLSQEEDPSKKEQHIDRIFQFYDEIVQCYGDEGYAMARKAFDLYYKYKDRATAGEKYTLFKRSIEVDGDSCNYFLVNPFAALLLEQYFEEKIDVAEAQKYANFLLNRLDLGLASGENQEQWKIIEEYLPRRLEAFEGVKGFFDCQYYKDKYYPLFLEDTTNCEVIGETFGRLKWGDCPEDDPILVEVMAVRNRHCRIEAPPSEARLAYEALRNGEYNDAIERFEKAANEAEDIEKKTRYLMLVANIYYVHLKNFPKAREFALQAANLRENWGEPFMLIGRMYASSGPLCGPGRGWDSQIVVWPAIDKWQYAKRIDPSMSDEANKWISRYAQYMPDVEDIFQRNLKEGDSFRVGCWIQETTRIRKAP